MSVKKREVRAIENKKKSGQTTHRQQIDWKGPQDTRVLVGPHEC